MYWLSVRRDYIQCNCITLAFSLFHIYFLLLVFRFDLVNYVTTAHALTHKEALSKIINTIMLAFVCSIYQQHFYMP